MFGGGQGAARLSILYGVYILLQVENGLEATAAPHTPD